MKKIALTCIGIFVASLVIAQEGKYTQQLENSSDITVEISIASSHLLVVGTDNSELKIERVKGETPCREYREIYEDMEKEMREMELERMEEELERSSDLSDEEIEEQIKKREADLKNRATGLKPIGPGAKGENIGLGLNIETSKNKVSISAVNFWKTGSDEFYIYLPKNVNLKLDDAFPGCPSTYEFKNFTGELILSLFNSDVKISDVTGPVVATGTNCDMEIVYKALAPDQPNSISAVNGFVDITMPASTKADLKISAINGQAYTDFAIDAKGDDSMADNPWLDMVNINGTINGGGTPINIASVNGEVFIRKKK